MEGYFVSKIALTSYISYKTSIIKLRNIKSEFTYKLPYFTTITKKSQFKKVLNYAIKFWLFDAND